MMTGAIIHRTLLLKVTVGFCNDTRLESIATPHVTPSMEAPMIVIRDYTQLEGAC